MSPAESSYVALKWALEWRVEGSRRLDEDTTARILKALNDSLARALQLHFLRASVSSNETTVCFCCLPTVQPI